MANIDCPLPRVLTYKEVRDAYNKARRDMPNLPGVSGHRREAARALVVDYKYYMDIFTKRLPSGSPPAAGARTARTVTGKKPSAAPKPTTTSAYKGEWVQDYDEYTEEAFVMKMNRTQMGYITKRKTGFNEDTGDDIFEFVIHSGTKPAPGPGYDSLWDAQRAITMQYAMKQPVVARVNDLLDRIPDSPLITKVKPLSTNATIKMGDDAESLLGRHFPSLKGTLDEQAKYAGDRSNNMFSGVVKFENGQDRSIAHYTPWQNTMAVNPKYVNLSTSELDRIHWDGERSRFYTYASKSDTGDGLNASVAHEYGHHVQTSIENYLARAQLPNISARLTGPFDVEDMFKETQLWQAEIGAMRVIQGQMYEEIIHDISRVFPRATLSITQKKALDAAFKVELPDKATLDTLLKDLARHPDPSIAGGRYNVEKTSDYVRDSWSQQFSYYSGTNSSEFFAEVWAEYSNGRAPRPHIKRIGASIQRALWRLEQLQKASAAS
jgi:hypothetical protein